MQPNLSEVKRWLLTFYVIKKNWDRTEEVVVSVCEDKAWLTFRTKTRLDFNSNNEELQLTGRGGAPIITGNCVIAGTARKNSKAKTRRDNKEEQIEPSAKTTVQMPTPRWARAAKETTMTHDTNNDVKVKGGLPRQ